MQFLTRLLPAFMIALFSLWCSAASAEEKLEAGAVSQDYLRLLKCVADPWLSTPSEAPRLVEHMPINVGYGRLGDFDGGKEPQLRQLVTRLRTAVGNKQQYDAFRNIADKAADNALDASQYNTRTFTQYDNNTGRVISSRTESGSTIEDFLGWGLARGLLAAAGEHANEKIQQAFSEATLSLGRMAPKMYGSSPAETGMIATRIAPNGITFENRSGHVLTDLTLHVEMVHFGTASDPFAYRVLYVPQMKAGSSIHISPKVRRNVEPEPGKSGKHFRPLITRKSPTAEESWLLESGGIVEVRVSAWAHEAHQEAVPEKFPEVASKAAAYEMRSVNRVLSRLSPWPKSDKNGKEDPDRTFAVEGARRVLLLAPDNAGLASEARTVTANLDGAAQKQRAILTQMVRKVVEGRFDGQYKATDKPPEMGFLSNKEFFAKKWESVKAKNGSGASVLEVSIIPLRNNRLVATLWDPSNPGARKTFTGPAPDVDMGQNTVELRAVNDADKADFARASSGQPPEEGPKSWSEAFKKSASRNSGASPTGSNGGTGGAKTSSLSISTLKGASLLDDKNSSGSKGIRSGSRTDSSQGPAKFGPEFENFNACAQQLILEFSDGKATGHGKSYGYEFPLTLARPEAVSAAPVALTPQQQAVQLYPVLGRPDSALNQEFLRRVKAYQQTKKDTFNDPNWPLKLAKESKDALEKR